MIEPGFGVLTNPLAGSHLVKVCRDREVKLEAVAHYVAEGLRNGEAVTVIARSRLRKSLIDCMGAFDFDTQSLQDQGQIKFLDAEFLLSSISFDGEIDAEAFEKFVASPMRTIKLKYGKLRIFGEMVDILWQKDSHDMAMQLEDLWNGLFKKFEFSMLCTYSLNHIDPDAYEEALKRICRCHTHHIPLKNPDSFLPSGSTAVLDSFELAWKQLVEKLTANDDKVLRMPPA